jgi:hypothetical protein
MRVINSTSPSLLLCICALVTTSAFTLLPQSKLEIQSSKSKLCESEWTSDFDDFVGDDDDSMNISSIFKSRGSKDLTATQSRQFSLGRDLIISDFVGNMQFDEVTDWEYFYENEEDPSDRKIVNPNPFDSSKPKRTRSSSGSVVSLSEVVLFVC